jgi:hypothetical protein
MSGIKKNLIFFALLAVDYNTGRELSLTTASFT